MADEDTTFTVDEEAYFATDGEKAPTASAEGGGQGVEPPAGVTAGAEDDPDGEGSPDARQNGGKIPLATHLEQRRELRETRQKLAEIERHTAVMNERWRLLEQAAQQPAQQQQDAPPDPEKDIFGYTAWLGQQVQAERAAREQMTQQQQEAARHQQIDSAVWQHWRGSAAEFSETQKDFGSAADFLAKARDTQLKSLAAVSPHLANKAGRDAVINNELRQIIIAAAQNSMSPAEVVYNMAKEWGYRPQAADDGAEVDKIAAAVGGAKSLSSVGGAKPQNTTAESIVNMSDREFAAWYAKPENVEKFRRLQGG